jgi:Cu+-exporting ATPase
MDAVHLSEETMRTIRQNLTWALLYNVVAIPMAAAGFLSPLLASFSMAFSDVVVIGNSLRIRAKKLPVLR